MSDQARVPSVPRRRPKAGTFWHSKSINTRFNKRLFFVTAVYEGKHGVMVSVQSNIAAVPQNLMLRAFLAGYSRCGGACLRQLPRVKEPR